MACGQNSMLKLYRNLLRESKKWCNYNYREFALRKIRHEFRKNKIIEDPTKIQDCYVKGLQSLETIKRQVIIGNLYKTNKLVIEMDKA
ncbi:PREDICTED: LYR motif-containing protein 4 [Ceratosolen solmsi marchali]|uniref:LYR motif-containing protein 4 n=1 Tax=Ceratosolen solmsi marchali TaxID=326594 RepID=A0AAJ6YLA9_9HYME|nr:PREDICTED: LYR motif-containing protein 4 [Ceratosolen solmsi marchali]